MCIQHSYAVGVYKVYVRSCRVSIINSRTIDFHPLEALAASMVAPVGSAMARLPHGGGGSQNQISCFWPKSSHGPQFEGAAIAKLWIYIHIYIYVLIFILICIHIYIYIYAYLFGILWLLGLLNPRLFSHSLTLDLRMYYIVTWSS